MRFIILAAIFLAASSCTNGEEKICWHEQPARCHTKAEWEQISKSNLEGIACLDKAITDLQPRNLNSEEMLEEAYKKCNLTETVRVYQ